MSICSCGCDSCVDIQLRSYRHDIHQSDGWLRAHSWKTGGCAAARRAWPRERERDGSGPQPTATKGNRVSERKMRPNRNKVWTACPNRNKVKTITTGRGGLFVTLTNGALQETQIEKWERRKWRRLEGYARDRCLHFRAGVDRPLQPRAQAPCPRRKGYHRPSTRKARTRARRRSDSA